MKNLFQKISISAMLATMCLLGAGQVMAQPPQMAKMVVTTDAFEDGGIIPIEYTSHGENIQPNFTITGAPETAVAFAVIFHDIEVAFGGPGDVLHWVAWNIPSANIPEGSLPEGSVTGANITRQSTYMGPGAPFADRYHHYVFEFYALSKNLDLPATASRDELLEALKAPGVVVGKAALVGKYANAQ